MKSHLARVVIVSVALAAFIGFIALGNWQLERRAWKLALIDRVTERAHASALPAPLPARWPDISRDADEYRAIVLRGHFQRELDIRVVAATELGSGYWIMTPLHTKERGTVLVNRGFIAQGIDAAPAPSGEVRVEGLLRLSEPAGSVLRDNVPAEDRWYSRDVQAIAERHGLRLAPYFVDARSDQPGSPGGSGPVGGLTIISFHNSHLVYALTWYGLAAMVVGAAVIVFRESRTLR